jgi:hypothetical protein
MGVLLCVTVFMVHPMHHSIGAGNEVRRPLEKPREEIKGLLPKRTGKVHLMGCIPVEEKGMEEQGKKPMDEKECQNDCHE